MCTEQNVTVGVPASEGRRSTERTFACGVFLEGEDLRVGLEGVLVEQDGEVRVASVRNELTGNVGDVFTGFLKNNRMKPSTDRRNGVPARRPWIPLKDRETVLMMHEIAVGCVNVTKPLSFGLPKFDYGENQCGELRIMRKWLVIRCSRMSLRNREYV